MFNFAEENDMIMKRLNEIIKENYKGEIFYDGWVKCKHMQRGLTHCDECLAINACWFYSPKSPIIPHHPNCHCKYEMIPTPTMNNCVARCPVGKIKDYIFGGYNSDGVTKQPILEFLGYTIDDSEYICKEFERQALKAYIERNYKLGTLNKYGQRITIDILLENNGKRYYKGSGWMVRENGEITNNTPIAKAINKKLENEVKNENKQYS